MLKHYQIDVDEQIARFAQLASTDGAAAAFEQLTQRPYQAFLGDTPIVCVQSGTGSGKTLMAVNSIATIAREYFPSTPRIILFLVPSDTLKQQTIRDLQNPAHLNYRLLKEGIGELFCCGDLTLLEQITSNQLASCVHVIVTTVQSLNIEKTESRRAYQGYEGHDSVVQTIAKSCPLIIIDEAHLNRTNLFKTVLANLNPHFVIEWTATPKDNNELSRTPLSALKEENMVKFPMQVQVNEDGPAGSLTECVRMRAHLEELAKTQARVVRPIALISADNKNGEFNVDAVLQLLLKEHGILREHIAIATGTQDELFDVDLQASDCPIRFVITIAALREGWNCPWAYCYCSMKEIGSQTAKEQFLGRICRLPDCTPFELEDLNRSYVFSHSNHFDGVVDAILDGLKSCGFTAEEARAFIQKPLATKAQTRIELPVEIVLEREIDGFCIKREEGKSILEIAPNLPYHELIGGCRQMQEQAAPEHKAVFVDLEKQQRQERFNDHSPSEQGDVFPPVAQIYLGNRLVTKEVFIQKLKWDEIDLPKDFKVDTIAASRVTLIDICSGNNFATVPAGLPVFHADLKAQANPNNLIGMAAMQVLKKVERVAGEVGYKRIRKWISQIVDSIVIKGADGLIALLGKRNAFTRLLADKILLIRDERLEKIFVGNLAQFHVNGEPYDIADAAIYRPPKVHPSRFLKHFFAVTGAMNAEEERWARKLDADPQVKWWIRNLETAHMRTEVSGYAFFLPLPTGRFFPDFIVLLHDGRIRLDEYKGSHIAEGTNTERKVRSGNLWARLTNNEFKLVTREDL